MADQNSLDVGHFAARLLAVTLPMGLSLDEIIIQGENVHLEKEPFQISLPEPGSMEVRISDASLAEFLNNRAPGGLSGFKVRFADGFIHVEAKASIIISVNVGAVCRLRIEDGTKLFVELVRMESIGGSGAHNLVQRQLDGINPIIDVKDLPFNAALDTVETEGAWLVLKGTISPR
ncbi:MAG TPA: LmeA family phospholipid-binding protein [Fimbriimonadaceae bacterium]|nr:LmeA family phospholipid-binding protein [Fimbriimonadaceae bacterium]